MSKYSGKGRAVFASVVVAASTLGAAASADEPTYTTSYPTVAPTDEASWDIPGRIVVDAVDSLDDAEVRDLGADFGLRFEETMLEDETRIELADVSASGVSGLLARLRGDPRVEWAEPLAHVNANFVANDPLLSDQWHMERVGASRAWDFATGHGVTVAVIDTGIACEDHGPFMKGTDLASTRCVGGWNVVTNNEHANDDQGHGTHVAGTIAQSTNNGIGATGLAFDARLMPVKVLNGRGWGTTANVADGIRWAADNGADVINLSLGGPRNSKILQAAVDHAVSKGVVVVAAAGNSGGAVGFPGASEGVIGVSATGKNDKIAPFSSRGDGVDIAAPGVAVVQQTICNGGRDKCEVYPEYSGTSMASPHVAGVAALIMSTGVTDPAAVEAILKDSARVVDESAGADKNYGAGILQAADAVQAISIKQLATRLLLLLGLSVLVLRGAGRRDGKASIWRPGYILGGLMAGPGLFFFAPWVLPRAHLAVDILARPLGEMDMYLGTGVHQWLPLANALVPLGLTALGFGIRSVRPWVAGIAVGTAAYLVSVAGLGMFRAPFGDIALWGWCGVNAIACMWLARMNLTSD